MWPFEDKADVIRVGRERAEYWASAATGLVLRGDHPIDCNQGADAAALALGLKGLMSAATQAAVRASNPMPAVHLVLESAWLPIALIDVVDSLWTREPTRALLAHQLAQLYGERGDPVSAWELQLDYRPGDQRGLGYGLAPAIKKAVMEAIDGVGMRIASLQPAFAWGWQRLVNARRKAGIGTANGSAWWIWLEQDRSIMCQLEQARVGTMNSGAAPIRNDSQCLVQLKIEARRCGQPADASRCIVAHWPAMAGVPHVGGSERVAWLSVAAAVTGAQEAARVRPPVRLTA